MNYFSNAPWADIIAYVIVFILGLVVKTKIQWNKTNTDVLQTLTADYQAIRELYNSKQEEIKRKNEQLLSQGKEILELRARIRSFENFLSSRPPEVDKILVQLSPILHAVAAHLNVPFEPDKLDAHPAAHSQADKQKFS